MNIVVISGYLPADATEAWSPATKEAPSQMRLLFEVRIKDSHGFEFPEKCIVESSEAIREWQPLLTAGRAVLIHGEQTSNPFYKNGVLSGYVRKVRVFRAEFPNRSGKKIEEEQPEETTV